MSFDLVPQLPRWRWFGFCAALSVAFALQAHEARAGVVIQDGPLLIEALILSEEAPKPWHHPFYIPIAWVIERLLGGEGMERRALEWTSAILGGAAIFSFGGAVRQWGRGLAESVALVALVASSPGLIVHSSIIEMHSGQLLGAATGAWLAALALRSRSGAASLALWFLAGAAAMGMHLLDSVLFAGGCIALFLLGVKQLRSGARAWQALRPVALALVGLGLAALLVETLSSKTVSTAAAGETGIEKAVWLVKGFFDGPSPTILWNEVLASYIGVFAVLLIGLARRNFAGDGRGLLFLTGLPLLVFVWMFGVPTAGGYALGALPFVALSAHLPRSRSALDRIVVVLAILGQVWLGRSILTSFDDERILRDFELRLTVAKELLPEGGVFLSGDIDWQPVSGIEPGLIEYTLARELADARIHDLPAEQFVALYIGGLERFITNWGTIAVDPTWREQAKREPWLAQYMGGLEAAIAQAPGARREPCSAGEAIVVEAPKASSDPSHEPEQP